MIRRFGWPPIVQSTLAAQPHCNPFLVSTFRNRYLTKQSLVLNKDRRRKRAPRDLATRANLYQVLHVSPTATKTQISASYRRLARKYHPDVNSSEEASKQYGALRVAYDILSNEARRKQYDEHGGGRWYDSGRRPRSEIPEAVKGADVLTVVRLSFLEAALGKRHSLQVSAKRACPDCVGSGSRAGARPVFCELCRGSGAVTAYQPGFQGSGMKWDIPCPACGARGIVRQEWCTRCGGDGRAASSVTVSIAIPAGVDAESVLKVRGQGDAGRSGGALGDLYITFLVKATAGMKRRGMDLYSEVIVRYTDAILGAMTEVPTIHGQAMLQIPAGTQSGQVLTMRGAGISPGSAGLAAAEGILQIGAGDSQRGAHHFIVIVLLPQQVSNEERMRLMQLRRLWSSDMSQACAVGAD